MSPTWLIAIAKAKWLCSIGISETCIGKVTTGINRQKLKLSYVTNLNTVRTIFNVNARDKIIETR